ncbi:hypothetical protein ECDEC12A_0430 [Escherichia coli DEC12A]|nr:hypothetical protein EcB171_5215 [Escherichia coli B171]EHX36589.1 hypothetical protein ECDEC12A_0430 [Escherichia coli DEC12A]EHX36758.1 hypothetical protein ECDEC12B_0418 [Escherichia coli DEC12B]EHX37731.1 hypothetical protein ECDEC12C_0356 [Escherichia coli DEC12C]EHX51558.1 hypothetical protein ECDEC12E_1644 [Escherichia coli DEC12E]EIQ72695.1 hypothetical protein ECEPECC34262_0434 [Escherichia coli EPEC C342-62]
MGSIAAQCAEIKGFCFSRGLQHWQLPVEIMAQQNDRRIGIDLSAG